MSQIDEKIGIEVEELARKAWGGKLRMPVMSGTVAAGSIDEAAMTCSVILAMNDEGVATEGVLLNGMYGDGHGMILYPADGSTVLVAEIDGPGQLAVILCSTIDKATVRIGSSKVTVTDGLCQFNDGGNGGLINVAALVEKVNALENDLNSLKSIFNSWAPVANDGGAALKLALTAAGYPTNNITLTVNADIEDTTVTH